LAGLALAYRQLQRKYLKLQQALDTLQRDEKHENSELHETIELHDGLFNIIEDALLVVDAPQQRILLANPAAKNLFGKDIVGETLIAATRNFELDQLVQE